MALILAIASSVSDKDWEIFGIGGELASFSGVPGLGMSVPRSERIVGGCKMVNGTVDLVSASESGAGLGELVGATWLVWRDLFLFELRQEPMAAPQIVQYLSSKEWED